MSIDPFLERQAMTAGAGGRRVGAMGEAALEYATRGWSVAPLWWPVDGRCACPQGAQCASPGKHPHRLVATGGLHSATTDPAAVTAWWTEAPNANIGLPTGHAFDVVDVDGPEGRGEGLDAYGRLCIVDDEAWAHGPVVITGKGGHFYVAPTGQGNRAKWLPGIDYRGRGGYVVAPPSIHVSGHVYRWSDECRCGWFGRPCVGHGPAAPLPAFGAAALAVLDRRAADTPTTAAPANRGTASAYGRRALEGELGRLAVAVAGQRNEALNRAAHALGQLVAGGALDGGDVFDALAHVARQIGLGDTEASRTIESGMMAGMRSPRRPAS